MNHQFIIWKKKNSPIFASTRQFYDVIIYDVIMVLFCETQWRHSVKTRLYNTPSPILYSVKRSDVTTSPSHIIHCISQLGENKGGRGH